MPAFINTKDELQTSTPVASSDFMDQSNEQIPRPKLTNATSKLPITLQNGVILFYGTKAAFAISAST